MNQEKLLKLQSGVRIGGKVRHLTLYVDNAYSIAKGGIALWWNLSLVGLRFIAFLVTYEL